jgi:hypothetical protein
VRPGDGEKHFGFSENMGDATDDTNIGSTYPTLDTISVPAGEVHVVRWVNFRYVGTVPTQMWVTSKDTPGGLRYLVESSVVSGVWYYGEVWCLLMPGDYMRLTAANATLGDEIYLKIEGYKLSIP